MDILISPTEPYEIKSDFGEYGISAPHLPSDYGWYVKGKRSLVQRKHIPGDMLASIQDGRFQRDMQILLENIEQGGRSYLLQEGHWSCDKQGMILNPVRPSGWSYEKISELLSTVQEMGIELLISPDISMTALVIISQVRWELKEDHSSLSRRPGLVAEWGKPSYASYTIWSYQGIPGVGGVTSIYAVHEVYYDNETGEITGWTAEPIKLGGFDSIQDLVDLVSKIYYDAEYTLKNPSLLPVLNLSEIESKIGDKSST